MAALLAGSCLVLPAAAAAQARSVQAIDGALSAPATGDRAAVALDWARANRGALGLTAAEVDDLDLTARATSRRTGFTHLRYRLSDRGIPAFDGGLRMSVDRGGRVLSAIASPAPRVDSAAPRLGAVEALRVLQREVGAERPVGVVSGPEGTRRMTRFESGDFARLVLFGGGRGTRLAWHLTYQENAAELHDAVVDASTGEVLFRQNLVKQAVPAEVFPSHPSLGSSVPVDLTPWLDPGATVLKGPYAQAYSDVDDSDAFSPSEQVVKTAGGFDFPFQRFGGLGCSDDAMCSWDPAISNSWRDNREQNAVQAFYLVNRFRDHLANDPNIGFDGFSGADALRVETDDGAETGPDGPNDKHINNANMATLPEGFAPRMQLFLFAGFGFRTVNGGDSAAIVWHEYTHGLSNRLVIHDDGTGALSSPQAGAMGEGWSDWYALDKLVGDGLMADTAAPGEVDVGHYVDATPHQVRTQGIDCPVAAVDARCSGGGYTFGDFANIVGGPEVHADGEIWAQTLWDLRAAVGRDVAQSLITEAMRMAPPEPSFLDMRNAILAADTGLGGASRTKIWQVFAARGMGYRAYSDGAGDLAPRQDFSVPPGGASGVVTGTVSSAESGLALGNASVGLASLTGQTAFADRLETATAANGSYALGAPAGTYGALTVELPGYDTVSLPDFAVPGARDVALRRDWAASAGGGFVFRSGYDDSGAPFGCGLTKLIDQQSTSGWSAVNSGDPVALVRLPAAIDVTGIGLDPTNTCGNGAGASTRDFRVETSPDGGSFTTVLTGTFTPADRGRLHVLGTDVRNVRYVRVTLVSAQGGSDFVDMSELTVYGAPPNTLPSGSLAASRAVVPAGGTVEFAASFTDPDSRITGYDWDFDGNGSVDRSTAEPTTAFTYTRAGDFAPTVAVRDYRGGAGTATRSITVTTRRPVVKLPRRGRRGKATARVRCAERCTVTARMRVAGRTVRTVRRTLSTTNERRIALKLPREVRRHRRTVRTRLTVSARYRDGRSSTARRTVTIRS